MDVENQNPAKTDGAERRRHRRFPCEGYAEVVCSRTAYLFRGRIRDVSLTGCFIETPARLRLEKSTEVELRFTANSLHITAPARLMVIRTGKGAGFEFLPANDETRVTFLKLIRRLQLSAEAASDMKPDQQKPDPQNLR